jgi:excisionase family DNA binding protein
MINVYSAREVAALLGVSKHTIYKFVKSGDLDASKVGYRTLRITEDALKKFLAKNKMRPSAEDHEILTKN